MRKMNLNICYILLLLLVGSTLKITGQVPTHLEVVLLPTTQITITDPDDHSVDSTQQYYHRFVFRVSDTINIVKIHAKIGSTDGGNDYLQEWFSFDQAINLQGSLEGYYRELYQVGIVVGTMIKHQDIFCEVKLEYNNGSFSPISQYRLTW